MTPDRTYEVAHPEIVFEQFDGDLVVLDLRSGKYYGFNPSAAALWDALMSGAGVNELEAAGVSSSRVGSFLTELIEAGLVITSEKESITITAELAERLSVLDEDPSLSSFDDLADLMAADPIHDVDAEFGWPHKIDHD